MPFVRKNKTAGNNPNTEEASAPPPGSAADLAARQKNFRGWVGTGTRLAGGLLSNAGGPLGATVGGGSELLAQLLEGSFFKEGTWDPNWTTNAARIGTEAAIGAVPMGNTIAKGRALLSAAKGGGFNLAGDVMRQTVEQYDPMMGKGITDTDIDWGRAGKAAGLGGVVSGTLGHLAPRWEKAVPKAPRPTVLTNSGDVLPKANLPSAVGNSSRPYPTNTEGAPFIGPGLPGVENPSRIPYATGDNGIESLSPNRSTRNIREESINRSVVAAADEEAQRSRILELRKLLSPDPEVSSADTFRASAPGGGTSSGSLRYSPDDADAPGGGGGRRGPRIPGASGVQIDPELDEIIARGMAAPEGSPQRNFALWLQDGKTYEEAEALVQKGIVPVSPARVSEITGAAPDIPITNPVTRVPGDIDAPTSGAVNGPARNPLAKMLGLGETEAPVSGQMHGPRNLSADDLDDITIDNPGGSAARTPDTQYGERLQTEGPWVDDALEDINWRQGEDVPSRFPDEPEAPPAAPAAPPPAPKDPPPGAGPSKPGGIPDGVQAKLDHAQQNWPPEAYDELRRLSGLYNDPATSKIGKREVGKQLSELRRFMEGSQGPKAGSPLEAGSKAGKALDPRGVKGATQVEAIMSAALGVGGAATGAALDDENPLRGAALGATAGALPFVPALLRSVSLPEDILEKAGGAREAAKAIYEQLPQFQRAAYLSDFRRLGQNIWLGPYGSMMTGGIEAGLKGDPRGWQLVKSAWNPVAFSKMWKNSLDEAIERLERGEMGRAEGLDVSSLSRSIPKDIAGVKQVAKTGMAGPGILMTMGDVAARRFIEAAGFSPEEARIMTLTSEPFSKLGKSIVNVSKNSTLGGILLPFGRTPTNIMEQGTFRTPGLGAIARGLGDEPINWRELGVEQAGGLGAGTIGYQFGQEMDDPRSTAQNVTRSALSNTAGRYSMPMSLGILLGQTVGRGENLTRRKIQQGAEQSIPLPGVNSIVDASMYAAGKMGMTSEDDPRLPRGVVPFQHLWDEEAPEKLTNYSRIRRRR